MLLVVLSAVPAGLPSAAVSSAAAQVTLATDVPPPRIAGGDRVATAEAVVGEWRRRGGTASTVVVVPRDQTAVALAAAGLAGRAQTAVLLSDLPPSASTVAAARGVGASRVLAVGGGQAFADAWAGAGFEVTSVHAEGGPPAVAAAIGRHLHADGRGETGPRHAYLAGTGGLPDALAAGPLAYADGDPLLLTAAGALDPHTRFLVETDQISAITVLGGEAVVGPAVVDELVALGVAVDRIAGPDREATALAVLARSAERGLAPSGILLAAGDDPADAAAAAPLAHRAGQAVLPPGPTTRAWLAARCGNAPPLTTLGGPAAIAARVDADLRAAAQRCGGPRDPMVVRVAVATPAAPGAEQEVLVAVTGPGGWHSRRVRFLGVADAPHLGVLVTDGVCGDAAICRRGRDLHVDAEAWRSADADGRRRLVNDAVGTWLGVAVRSGCTGSVMDPVGCAAAPGPSPAEVAAVEDRYVPSATLAFGGDVHGERHIATAVAEGRNPLGPVAELLSAADLAVVNLETPLSTRGTPAAKTYTFRGPPGMAADLAEAGVDVVTLANNHALDYGVTALADTLDHARDAGLATVGAGLDASQAYAAHLTDTPAGRVAVVGLTRVLHTRAWEAGPGRPGLASGYDESAAIAAVQAARDTADHVVVAVHWGTERADCPDAGQGRLARLLIEAGADVVVGHHPHVLQGVEVRDGDALVAYSLGNFVWYHTAVPSRYTGVLAVELPLLDEPQWSFTPAEIRADGSPHPVGGALGDAIAARVRDRSPGGSLGCAFP
ncbi:CapA family protein [Euzebya sp.]|uniref:CapA family protein n=1 Tax=Euzebya sp. TaxID=1971409 RepID=UPI003515522C